MQLIVSRLAEVHQGMMVSLKDEDKIDTIGMVNGNKSTFKGPVILTDLDQDIVYGMSHRQVVSRIYSDGPQILLTTREYAHRLYEHGMKAALGKIKFGNNVFQTCLETYYKPSPQYGRFTLDNFEGVIGCRFDYGGYQPILITTSKYAKPVEFQRIDVDKIQQDVAIKLVSF